MTRTLVVLRPEPGNAATVARAQAAGFATLSLPLFAVRAVAWDAPDPAEYNCLVLTSANTLRFGGDALATFSALPVLAVGPHTAAAAHDAGFRVVATGHGDGAGIAAHAAAAGFSRALHLTGVDRTLGAGGAIARVIAVYESVELALDPCAMAALPAGATALLHSARAARRFAGLVDDAGRDRAGITIAALSPAIAAAAGTGWAGSVGAATPDDAALFAALTAEDHAQGVDRPRAHPDKTVMDEPVPKAPDAAAAYAMDPDAPPVQPSFTRTLPPFVAPAPPPPRPGTSWRTVVVLGLIAFLIGVGATVLAVTKYGKVVAPRPVAAVPPPAAPTQSPVVIVPDRTAPAVPTIDLAALSSREAELSARIDTLEARTGTVGQDAARAAGYATRSEGLMIAFAARRALDRGLNLGFLEEQLRSRFGASQPAAVATVVQAARDPVTLEDLRAGLDGVAPELLTGASTSGWWQSLRREATTLIVLRKAGTPSALPVDRLARARRLIEAGQVEAALAEVSRTPGAAQALRWTGAARRYIGARRALDAIESAAIVAPDVDAPAPPVSVPTPVSQTPALPTVY